MANVLSSNPEIDALLDDLVADDPDVVAILEVPTSLDLDQAEQIRWLADRQRDGAHRVVLGDLNLTRHNPSFATLIAAGLHDTLADVGMAGARTWTGFRAGPDLLQLDHVLATPELEATRVQVLPRRGSDHRALRADIRLR